MHAFLTYYCLFAVVPACPRCSYDHPPVAHKSISGPSGFHAGTAAPSGPTTSGSTQSVQHGHDPRQSPQQQPHNQQQQQQHLYAQQPQHVQETQTSQQQHQPPYGQQPLTVMQTSLGQQRVSLHSTPVPSRSGPSTSGSYTGNSSGNPCGGSINSSTTTTPSAPSPVQTPGTQLGRRRHSIPTPFNSAESAASTDIARTLDNFEHPSPSIAPKAHGALGSIYETPPSRRLQPGNATAQAPTTPATAAVVSSVPVPAASSTVASTVDWVYDHTTGGYKIAALLSSTAGSVEPARGVTAAGTSDVSAQNFGQRQQPGSAYVTPSTQQQTWPCAGGYNGAAASHGQNGDAPVVAATSGTHLSSPACSPVFSGQQQQQQPQPSNYSTALPGAPHPSAHYWTNRQNSAHPGATLTAPGQPAGGASSAGSIAPVSVGYGGSTRSATATSEYGLQGIPPVYEFPPSASPQQEHGVPRQTPFLHYGFACPANTPGPTPSAPPADGDIATTSSSSSYRGVLSTGAHSQRYSEALSTTPAPTAEAYVVSGSKGVGRSSPYGAYGSSRSCSGKASKTSSGGGQQVCYFCTFQDGLCL